MRQAGVMVDGVWLCLPQIKREHIGDAVHPGSDGTECVLLPRRNVISAHPCSRIDECVLGVRFQNAAQMHLAQYNDVVQTFPPDRSDQPFGKAILPGRGRCNRFVSNAHGAQSACDDGAIDPIAITDHVTRSPVPRKSLGDLACDPFRRRVGCDVDPDQLSTVNPKPYSSLKPMVGTANRSMAAMSGAWFRRKVRHP